MFSYYIVEIVLLFCAFFVFMWWWKSREAAQIALVAVKRHCKQLDLQLLDYYVAASRLKLRRDDRNNWRLWRYYEFEFSSTGDERYHGSVVVVGKSIQQIQLEPHRIQSAEDSF